MSDTLTPNPLLANHVHVWIKHMNPNPPLLTLKYMHPPYFALQAQMKKTHNRWLRWPLQGHLAVYMQLVGTGKHHTKCVPVCVYSEMLAVSATISRTIVALADLLP